MPWPRGTPPQAPPGGGKWGRHRYGNTRTIDPMDDSAPRIRASDDDRNKVAAALSEAFSQGRLDYEEFDERTRRVWGMRYRDELLTPLRDLLPDPAQVLEGQLPVARPDNAPAPTGRLVPSIRQITREPGGDRISLSIMGGTEKQGDWLCAPEHVSLALMGGNEVDLRHARFGSRETTIWALAVMGGIDIIVPEDMRVISDGIGIMGGFGFETDKDVSLRHEDLPPEAPVIRIRGLALMGGVTIIRKRRDTR